jgi:3-hydroxyisobutyrate dehydrogenase-like beta-hydroxyacid dehydrogenase
MANDPTPTTVLGLGEMGSAPASALIDAGHPTIVWNRSPAKAEPLAERGATVAGTVEAVNVTTTTPNQARELAAWAARQGADYLDGGIMAVPELIGGPGSAVLYSGSEPVFDQHRAVLDRWGQSTYFGRDAGMASLYDLAMLAAMYAMLAGFMHGAAMVGSEGVSARAFATRAAPFLAAMTGALTRYAATIDATDYTGEGQQSLEFSDLTRIVTASVEQGVSAEVLAPVHAMIQRQIAAGHGKQGLARIFEELRATR